MSYLYNTHLEYRKLSRPTGGFHGLLHIPPSNHNPPWNTRATRGQLIERSFFVVFVLVASFRKGVTFDGNNAESGGAFSLMLGEIWERWVLQ